MQVVSDWERKFHNVFILGNESSMTFSLLRTKVPCHFRSQERKFQDTFAPGSESSMSFSLLGMKVPYIELSFLGTIVLENESSCYLFMHLQVSKHASWQQLSASHQHSCSLKCDILPSFRRPWSDAIYLHGTRNIQTQTTNTLNHTTLAMCISASFWYQFLQDCATPISLP